MNMMYGPNKRDNETLPLTLKVLSKIVANKILFFFYYYYYFSEKTDLTFHVNHLLGGQLYNFSSLIFFEIYIYI